MRDIIELITSSPAVMVCFILLGLLIVSLSILVTPLLLRRNVRHLVDSGLNKMQDMRSERRILKEARKYATIRVKMNVIDKIELRFIHKSNIQHWVPFFNIYALLGLTIIIFLVAFRPIYLIIYSPLAAIMIASMVASVPFVALEILSKYNMEKVRRKLSNFISVLNRWCNVKEDIVYAFEKSIDSGIGEPLSTYVRDLVIQIKRGLDINEALDILQMKIDNIQFRDFIINIQQNIRQRGDIRKLLANLEDEYYRLEEEFMRRKISTYKDMVIVYCSMIMVLVVGYFFLRFNPNVKEFYLTTKLGKGLMTMFSVTFFIAFLLSLRVTKFNH